MRFPGKKVLSSLVIYQAGCMSIADVNAESGAFTLAVKPDHGTVSQTEKTLKKPPKTLVNPQASKTAQALLSKLVDRYGSQTIAGQQDLDELAYIQTITQKQPAILGGDLMDYSPSRVRHGTKPAGTTESLIDYARKGFIITLSWHWNAPTDLINQEKFINAQGKTINALWWRGFYTEATTFDVKKALADPKSADYKLLLRDIDAIAVELKKFSDAGIPVLWRPLHEAEGAWFWWGAKGPEPFKSLWHLMFERLTKQHQLHNLIWVYSSGTKPEWYPGGDVVDIVGIDAYPANVTDPLIKSWDTLKKQYDGKKMLALTEFGGVPDIARMHQQGVKWSYFMSWTKEVGPHKMSPETLKGIYQDNAVVTLDKFPLP